MRSAYAGARRAAAPEGAGVSASYAASLSMLIVCMSVFVANIALPSIAADLGGGMVIQQWVISGYTLPFAALLIASGSVSDRIGAKRTLFSASLAYGLVSAACPFAPSMEALVALQIALGSLGAFMLPSSMSLIDETYPDGPQKSKALMLWGIGGSSASAVGPLAGGALVQVHWGLAFVVNVPFCIAIALLCANEPNRTVSQEGKPWDMAGLALGTAGLAAFVGGIILLGDASSEVFAAFLLAFGCALLALFAWREKRFAHPVFPMDLFGKRGTRTALLAGFAMIFAWNGSVFACTLLLQGELGFSPLESGFAFAPAALACMLGNVVGEKLVNRKGIMFPLVFGGAVLLAGYVALALGFCWQSSAAIALAMSLAGMGGAVVTPVLALMILTQSERGASGAASAAFNAMRQVGGTVGVAVYGMALSVTASPVGGFLGASFVSLLMLSAMVISFVRVR